MNKEADRFHAKAMNTNPASSKRNWQCFTWLPICALASLMVTAGCGESNNQPASRPPMEKPDFLKSFAESRLEFTTKPLEQLSDGTPAPAPPKGMFNLVKYESPIGKMDAYVTPPSGDGKKHPAIIWVSGGFSTSIDDLAWSDYPEENDQSASIYGKTGIVMMYPSFRGGNENPGTMESFYGEVDDLLAALTYLGEQPHVDASRIYLGGHSTGGTMALLAAAASGKRFRAVFAFGPVASVAGYGDDVVNFDANDEDERRMRAPALWMRDIKTRTLVLEGEDGNANSLGILSNATPTSATTFHLIKGGNHFNVLAPLNRLLAQKILADSGPECAITLSAEEAQKAMAGN